MRTHYRLMLGKQSIHAAECVAGGFIGVDYGITDDLTGKLPDTLREFNAQYIPVYLANRPQKSKIAAGLACGVVWTVGRSMAVGDVVLCPDGAGGCHVGEVTGPYQFASGGPLPHRRPVKWLPAKIDRDDMTSGLRQIVGLIGAVCNLSKAGYADEVEALLGGFVAVPVETPETTPADAAKFPMEKHLEDFLVQNWAKTELGTQYDIYEVDGELAGQQYLTDTGPLDILAQSKDGSTLLVVELKRGKASDAVVGQTLRYMGYVQEELAADGQQVQGVIIALEDDPRIRRALQMVPSVAFYRYQVSFKLVKS